MLSTPTRYDSLCPEREVLFAFAHGRLPMDALEAVAEHLERCRHCASLLDALHASAETDSVQEQVRRCLLSPSPREIAAWDAVEGQFTVPDRPGAGVASSSDFTIDQNVGTTLAGYCLIERLGKGGMGVVYRAVQLALGRQVAVKTLHHQALDSPALCARFRTEGAALARLDHPGIVRVLDLAEHQGTPLLVMELVEGQTLAQRLRAGMLDFHQAAELVRDLATAVAYAHSRGVLHRDLKPSNVLLDASGTPRVADFGLAKLLDRDDSLTASDMVLGTPSYMAPEQASARPVGPVADVWAMGAVLYECLTRQPPFKGESKLATLGLVRTAPLQPPSRLRPGLPPGLEAICLKCLEKDPARRYRSAAALADDLGRWLAGQQPHSARWVVGLTRRLRQRPGWMPGAALLACSAVAMLWYTQRDTPPPVSVAAAPVASVRLVDGAMRQLFDPDVRRGWRVLTGESALSVLDAEGVLTLTGRSTSLIELLANPGQNAYRLSGQVRPAPGTTVGLYVAGQEFRPGGIHYVTLLSIGESGGQLSTRLIANRGNGASVEETLATAQLPGSPVSADGWYDLAITVHAERLILRGSGRGMEMKTDSWLAGVEHGRRLLAPRLSSAGLPARFPALLHLRGGLGLYLHRGSASFRHVRLTPLHEAP